MTPLDATQTLTSASSADRRKRLSSGSSIDPRKRSDSPTILDLISIDDEIIDAIDIVGDAEKTPNAGNGPLSTSCPNNIHVLVDTNRRQTPTPSEGGNHRPSSGTLERTKRAPSVSINKNSAGNGIQYKSGYAQMHQQTTARKQVNLQVDDRDSSLYILCHIQ